MEIKRVDIKGSDELDVLSAIWILACNDETRLSPTKELNTGLSYPTDTT
jgi:hypothetical protein